MFEIVKAGGPMMGPIILASIVAAAIILERLWTLQIEARAARRSSPTRCGAGSSRGRSRTSTSPRSSRIRRSAKSSPPGLANRHRDRAILKEAIEDTGRHVVHELDRFIGTLGMIASLSPLMGLLGTVLGMIRTFNAITTSGVGNPTALAGGIAEALIATAAGLAVAIPATISYRLLRGRVERLVVAMEKEAMKLVHAIEHQPGVRAHASSQSGSRGAAA